jgi:hypothetical protein
MHSEGSVFKQTANGPSRDQYKSKICFQILCIYALFKCYPPIYT